MQKFEPAKVVDIPTVKRIEELTPLSFSFRPDTDCRRGRRSGLHPVELGRQESFASENHGEQI